MYAKTNIYSGILLGKNISLLTSSYKKYFFFVLFELAPVSAIVPILCKRLVDTFPLILLIVYFKANAYGDM